MIYVYIAVMALVTYLVRALPFTLFKNKVKSPFLRLFFAYIPYAVLAAMTVPQMFFDAKNALCGGIGLVTAIILAYCNRSLITVASLTCLASFIAGLFI